MSDLSNIDIEYILNSFKNLKTDFNYPDPVKWIEDNRYLPRELTPKPGYVNYDATCAYWKEPLYELSPLSNTFEVGILKSRQTMATTSMLEAIIAYGIKFALGPLMYATSTGDMLGRAFDTKIERLIDNCDLRDLIGDSSGKVNSRSSSDKKIEKNFLNGTFLHGVSLQSISQSKSMTYRIQLLDEIDEGSQDLKNQGNAISIITKATRIAYGENGGKILYISTPTIEQTSQIYKIYLQGDQRQYWLRCPRCQDEIVLKWHIEPKDTKTGDKAGIVFTVMASGNVDYSAGVFYKCQQCGGIIENDEKAFMLPTGIWKPQTESKIERMKTYHINSLYAPVGIFSWHSIVAEFSKGWDFKTNTVKDINEYKDFRNNYQGLPFKKQVSGIKLENVTSHKRSGFRKNNIPNKIANAETGSPVLILLGSVDVHKRNLRFDITGYTQGGQSWKVDWRTITPDDNDIYDCTNKNCSAWNKVREIINNEIWTADDGKVYKLQAIAFDSGKYTDTVYQFCSEFGPHVIPIKGKTDFADGSNFKQMKDISGFIGEGTNGYTIAVNNYKSRIQSLYKSVRKLVNGRQSDWTMNFNSDLPQSYFKMFTNEHEEEKVNTKTNIVEKIEWVQDGENHGFDTDIYNKALLEIVATNLCEYGTDGYDGLDQLSWSYFWDRALTGMYYN